MNPRLTTILMIIIAAALIRILPHPPNVTPVAAMALFAGAYVSDRRLALLIPLAALLISDLVIGIHDTMLYVYVGMAITVFIGAMLRNRPTVLPAIAASFGASAIFFLITNYGAWMGNPIYPQTMQGLMAAMTAGIPFFRNSVLGDLFFTAVLFGGFQFLQQTWLAGKSAPGAH
jgi:hypothetical protein